MFQRNLTTSTQRVNLRLGLAGWIALCLGTGCGHPPIADSGQAEAEPQPAETATANVGVANGPGIEDGTDVELAKLMGEMQRHSAKLGYAIDGRNRPLAELYLEEVDEVLEELLTVEEDEGMPIAHPARAILRPSLETLASALRSEPMDWPRAWEGYEQAIDACNRCHLATEHGFLHILPARGESPFNQSFAVEP